jgi:hypothetical protein
VTDFHYDPTYLDNAISCEKNASGRGMYGHSWCDSPWKLITSSIDAMHINKADVDFIIQNVCPVSLKQTYILFLHTLSI